MDPHRYIPVPFMTGLWGHRTRSTKTCLSVDNFGVKYFSKDDVGHLLNSLSRDYVVLIDWGGCNYLRLTIKWNYKEAYVNISMPEYVAKELERLRHPKPKLPHYDPHQWTVPDYGI